MLGKIKKKFKVLFDSRMTKEDIHKIDQKIWQVCETYAHDYATLVQHIEVAQRQYGGYVFQSFFYHLFSLSLDEEQAALVWASCKAEHQKLSQQATLDFRASFFNTLLQQKELLLEPIIVEKSQWQALQKDVMTDELTGLFNKRYLNKSIEREILRAKRRSTLCSLIFIDIDHFKHLNDKYGHVSGDKVLKAIADVILQSVRSCDLPCRYGGEEFAILLPDTDKQGGQLLAERIREGIHDIRILGIRERVSVSAGVAAFPEDAQNGNELIHLADKAMYQAKHLGRDRVEVYKKSGDKRHHGRKPLKISGSLRTNAHTAHNEFFTKNMSRSGLLLETNQALSLGQTVHISLGNEDEAEGISLVAHVVHLKFEKTYETFQLGLRIVHMEQPHEQRYMALLEKSA